MQIEKRGFVRMSRRPNGQVIIARCVRSAEGVKVRWAMDRADARTSHRYSAIGRARG